MGPLSMRDCFVRRAKLPPSNTIWDWAADTADTALKPLTGSASRHSSPRSGRPRISGREWRESERVRSGFLSIFFIESPQNDKTLGVENSHHHHSYSFDHAGLQGECARLDSLQFARFASPKPSNRDSCPQSSPSRSASAVSAPCQRRQRPVASLRAHFQYVDVA